MRPRGSNNSSSRGGKGGGDRYGARGGPNQFSSNGKCVQIINLACLVYNYVGSDKCTNLQVFCQSRVLFMVNLHTRRKMERMLMRDHQLLHLLWLEITWVDDLPHTGSNTYQMIFFSLLLKIGQSS